MKLFFPETPGFTEWVDEQPENWDAEFSALQVRLMNDPEAGKVMKGCGGLRKIRMPDPKRGKGKRGGARIVYLHIPEANCLWMVEAFDKDEKGDLTPDERKSFASFAAIVKEKALRAARQHEEGEESK